MSSTKADMEAKKKTKKKQELQFTTTDYVEIEKPLL